MEGKKKVKKYNAWQLHVIQVKKDNPTLSLKQVLIKAKGRYKK